MGVLYEFPMKKELPENLEAELRKYARDYVNMIDRYYDEICDECATEEGMNEILRLVSDTLMEEVALAVYELEW